MVNGIWTISPNLWIKYIKGSATDFGTKYLKKAEGHIGRNVAYITMKLKIIVWIF